ncbi:MAG: [FeFe] hydrogenase, group A [Phascolarctobacterium sp.]|uniref:[FeFe] hydrogenase, group A n=1 Tax=Phascolarctobacterium sp. TaxID=2049039 RepID=UPI0026DCAB02|nr:[FeFe] hydrogenase, group A [Phascolarctobacterium sp.]MDO4922050.1 [FeFe] hydrogenase, group A [Phascolarctobacterium sp.]
MVNLKIDGFDVAVPEGTTIMQAAAAAGIDIPRLCYLKGVNEISACKVCVVEIQGQNRVVTSCTTPVQEGLVVYTNSPKARSVRRTNVELILSQHDCLCATCVRSGNCSLQKLSNDLGIYDIPFERDVVDTPWNQDFPLIRDSKKCIKCMRCVQICDKIQDLHIWDVQNTGARTTVDVAGNISIEASNCSLCGQCITHCPVGALKERNDVPKIYEVLADPAKVTVVQVAPAVRTAWAEAFNLPEELATEGRMVAALKRVGFDYVFDTTFAADVTIMEEASELLERLHNPDGHRWPMFTSCCPGWVSYVTKKYPSFVANLSTTKSPQQIFGAIAKSFFAERKGLKPKEICSISIMPCVSKKREAALLSMRSSGAHDVDIVLTTRELIRLLRAEHINPATLPEEPFDNPLGQSTGAGILFGATGGVMEAALRTAYHAVTGQEAPFDAFVSVRGEDGRKVSEFTIGGVTLRTCTVSGLGNAGRLLDDLKAGKVHYDFVEVMACPGGCVGGGGQPIHDGQERAGMLGKKLYKLDEKRCLRQSHNNPDVIALYDGFFGKPLSEKAEKLLHSDHLKEKNYLV